MGNTSRTLRRLGFSVVAEKIYFILLTREGCSIAELARLTGKHRPAIYQALPELLAANLVSKSQQGKRVFYQAESPGAIAVIAKQQTENLESVLPELTMLFQQKSKHAKIFYYRGKHGIRTAYEELMNSTPKGGVIYRYESPSDYQAKKDYYPQLYWQRASSKGDIDKVVITNLDTQQRRRSKINRVSKGLPGKFDYDITQLIGKDRVVIIDYDTDQATAIVDRRFASFQLALFKALFDRL